jgi:8-oxo-dGTP pyrophosphatase MutT (NUDIX family)
MRLKFVSDKLIGKGGFLSLRRLRVVNVHDDGRTSKPYPCDFVDRPMGIDAVAVVVYAKQPEGVRVLLRDAIRPALGYASHGKDGFWSTEVVAGILEKNDRGRIGILRRAAAEAREEAGFHVSPQKVVMLGEPTFMSPGLAAERMWFTAVRVNPSRAQAPEGDGTPMEETRCIRWVALDDAIGLVRDAKSEIALRRFAEKFVRARSRDLR